MMDLSRELKLMRAYVICSTLLLGALLVSAFRRNEGLLLEELTVHRINIVDSAGRTRLTLAGNLPPQRRNDWAGLLFYNNEGREAGGLIYAGQKSDGRVSAGGGFTLDQYGTDQIVALEYADESGRRRQGLTVSERPDSMSPQVREFFRALSHMQLPPGSGQAAVDSVVRALRMSMNISQDQLGSRRLFVGRDTSSAAIVSLADAQGLSRLRLAVDSFGNASITFLDRHGRATRVIRP